jgi:hypothetical protein
VKGQKTRVKNFFGAPRVARSSNIFFGMWVGQVVETPRTLWIFPHVPLICGFARGLIHVSLYDQGKYEML